MNHLKGLRINGDSSGAFWISADHDLLWSGPAAPKGAFADVVNIDVERQQIWARVKLAKFFEDDEGYSGMLFKEVLDEIPLTNENLARYNLQVISDYDGKLTGIRWTVHD